MENKIIIKYASIFTLAIFFSTSGHIGSISFYIGVLMLSLVFKVKSVITDTRILLIPLIIAFFVGLFFKPYTLWEVFKDLFYMISWLIMLVLGECFYKILRPRDFLKMLVYSGSFFSVVNVIGNFYTSGVQILFDPRAIRDGDGYFGSVCIIAMLAFLILLHWRLYTRNQLPNHWKQIMLINILALYFSGSRTYWLVILILSSIILYPKLKKKTYISIVLVGVFGILTVFLTSSDGRTSNIIKHSIVEMTAGNAKNISEANENYRAYEAFMAMSQYAAYPIVNKFVGNGMGATVDMGPTSPVGLRYIPILHNGYPYLLIKMGLLGFIVYIVYFISLIIRFVRWKGRIKKINNSIWKAISCGSVLALLVMHFSVNAIFNQGYNSILIFVGYTLANITWKKQKNQSRFLSSSLTTTL